jgi:hypothetical protein
MEIKMNKEYFKSPQAIFKMLEIVSMSQLTKKLAALKLLLKLFN